MALTTACSRIFKSASAVRRDSNLNASDVFPQKLGTWYASISIGGLANRRGDVSGGGDDVLILFGAQMPGFICFGFFADVGALRLEQASEWS